MAWQKSPEDLVARFHAVLPDLPEVGRRMMFGYPCAFVNGNMFAGLFQDYMILRLDEADRAILTAMPDGGLFEPMAGRPMKQYARVPPAILKDDGAMADWVGRSFAFVAAMKPKERKPRKSKKQA